MEWFLRDWMGFLYSNHVNVCSSAALLASRRTVRNAVNWH